MIRLLRGTGALALTAMVCSCGGGTSDPNSPSAVVAAVEVTPGSALLFDGDTLRLAATPRSAAGSPVAGKTVSWASSAPAVASVSSAGLVTALTTGSSTITATVDAKHASATVTVTALAPEVSASVGPSGGSLSSPLSDGTLVQLTIPSGALDAATTISLTPARPEPGARATFLLQPERLSFIKPVQLRFTLASPASFPALSLRSGTLTLIVPLTRDPDATHLVASLTAFGVVAQAPAAIRMPPGTNPNVGGASTSLIDPTLAQLFVSAQDALTVMQRDRTLTAATALDGVMETLAQSRSLPNFAPGGPTLLQQWHDALCPRFDQAVIHYTGLSVVPPFDFLQYYAESNDLVRWAAAAAPLGDVSQNFPFAGCSADYLTALTAKTDTFITRQVTELSDTARRDLLVRFNEFLDSNLFHALQLKATLNGFGITAFDAKANEAIARILDVLRPVAWKFCRELRDYTQLARLLDLELTDENYSNYTEEDLISDGEECGTNLVWRTRDSDSSLTGTGTLGGQGAGQVALRASASIPLGGDVSIGGLLQLVFCPGAYPRGEGSHENEERLDLVAGYRGQEATLLSRPVPFGGPREYLHNDSLRVTQDQVKAALHLADGDGPVTLTVRRVGITCHDAMGALPPSRDLAILDAELPATCGHLMAASAPLGAAVSGATCGLTITTTSLPNGVQGAGYNQTLQASGGTGTYAWSLASGSFPPGLTLTGATGAISGTPTVTGVFGFTARVSSGTTSRTKALSIAVQLPSQLDFSFDHDLEGWIPGVSNPCPFRPCGPDWGTVTWSLEVGALHTVGAITLDGTGGAGQPNAWISHAFVLPAGVATLAFDVWGHNVLHADAHFRVRVVDNTGSHTLDDEVIVGGPDESLVIFHKQLDISAWAGKNVTIFFEQDDNGFEGGPGQHEQIVLDNIHIH